MAAAAPAAAASSEAPAVTGTAEPETGDEDSREVRVLQSLRGRICKRGRDCGGTPGRRGGWAAGTRGGGGPGGRPGLVRLDGGVLGEAPRRPAARPARVGAPFGASGVGTCARGPAAARGAAWSAAWTREPGARPGACGVSGLPPTQACGRPRTTGAARGGSPVVITREARLGREAGWGGAGPSRAEG